MESNENKEQNKEQNQEQTQQIEEEVIPQVKISTDREFEEVEGGYYLENGFYVTPNGSFWDSDGVYFNRQGYDRHEGYYDPEYEYHPGRGWIPHMLCYEDEIEKEGGEDIEGEGDDLLDYENLDDLHDEVDYGKLAEEKDKSECIIKKAILTFPKKEEVK